MALLLSQYEALWKKKKKNEVKVVVENEAKPPMWQNFKNFDKIIF